MIRVSGMWAMMWRMPPLILALSLASGCHVYKGAVDSYIKDKEVRLVSGQVEDELRNGSDHTMCALPDIDGVLRIRYSLDTDELWGKGTARQSRDELLRAFTRCGWCEVAPLAPPRDPNGFYGYSKLAWWPKTEMSSATGTFLSGPSSARVWIPKGEACFCLWDLGR